MSGAVNEAIAVDAEPLVESETDARETVMTYDDAAFPKWVLAIWVVSMLALGGYALTYALPDLRLWLHG
jgi:hypothetical protein